MGRLNCRKELGWLAGALDLEARGRETRRTLRQLWPLGSLLGLSTRLLLFIPPVDTNSPHPSHPEWDFRSNLQNAMVFKKCHAQLSPIDSRFTGLIINRPTCSSTVRWHPYMNVLERGLQKLLQNPSNLRPSYVMEGHREPEGAGTCRHHFNPYTIIFHFHTKLLETLSLSSHA